VIVSPTRTRATSLETGDDVADLTGRELLDRRHARLRSPVLRARTPVPSAIAFNAWRREKLPVDHAYEGHDAAVLVVGGVEDERRADALGSPDGRRDPLDHRFQQPPPRRHRSCRDRKYVLGRTAD